MQLTIELLQEAKITFEEQAKVIDAITQHRQTFKTGTESKTDVRFRIQAKVTHHVRMHFTGTRDFQPTTLLRTTREHHVHFNRRFRKREVARTETNDQVIRFKEAAHMVAT